MYGIRAPTTGGGQHKHLHKRTKLYIDLDDRHTSIIESISEVYQTTAQDPPFVHRRTVPSLHQANRIVLSRCWRTAHLELVGCLWRLRSCPVLLVEIVAIAVLASFYWLEFDVREDSDVRVFTIALLICWSRVCWCDGLDVEHAMETGGGHIASG